MIKIFSIKEIINASESILNINTKKTKKSFKTISMRPRPP